jgi:predicted  nucleic acid-binding Zn-ribbon protein
VGPFPQKRLTAAWLTARVNAIAELRWPDRCYRTAEETLCEELERLRRLQALDLELSEIRRSLSSVTRELEELRTQICESQTELQELELEDKQASRARRELEQVLAEGETQIRLKRMRLTSVRNERELQALEHEIETLKQSNQNLETELLGRIEAADQRANRLNELRALIDQKQSLLQDLQKSSAARVEELNAQLAKHQAEREQVIAQVEPTLRQRYEMILERRAGLALVAARAEACQGCRMRLPPQLYNEIQRGTSINFCPSCQRILYFES